MQCYLKMNRYKLKWTSVPKRVFHILAVNDSMINSNSVILGVIDGCAAIKIKGAYQSHFVLYFYLVTSQVHFGLATMSFHASASSQATTITIHHFAASRDAANASTEEFTFLLQPSLSDITKALIERHGEMMEKVLKSAMYAVNMEYVEREKESEVFVSSTDEVAIIPPVSGG